MTPEIRKGLLNGSQEHDGGCVDGEGEGGAVSEIRDGERATVKEVILE